MSNPGNFKPFELTGETESPGEAVASDIKLTSSGGFVSTNPGDTARYVCKITDATINFAGDNSKFAENDKKKLNNTLFLVLPKEQSENLQRIIDETGRENHYPKNNQRTFRESSMRREERTFHTGNAMERLNSK